MFVFDKTFLKKIKSRQISNEIPVRLDKNFTKKFFLGHDQTNCGSCDFEKDDLCTGVDKSDIVLSG